mgnify:FL=1
MSKILLAVVLLAGGVDASAAGRLHRNSAARRQFRRGHPCPATGRRAGPCPGYVIDHIIPLACGGPDRPSNMQWQTREEARAKDRWERKGCGGRR